MVRSMVSLYPRVRGADDGVVVLLVAGAPLPPQARGCRLERQRTVPDVASTPAYAGLTWPRGSGWASTTLYPRVRGADSWPGWARR